MPLAPCAAKEMMLAPPTLKLVLQLAYRPEVQWKYNKLPEGYKPQDTVEGISFASLDTELKRLYIFQKGNPTAEKLENRKQEELLIRMLESLEPREAEVVMGIFNKDLGVKGLDYKFVKEAFPQLLP